MYGGHTIGLALAQATRALPNLVTVLGLEVLRPHRTGARGRHPVQRDPRRAGDGRCPVAAAGVLALRSLVYAVGETDRQVLDWRFTALQF